MLMQPIFNKLLGKGLFLRFCPLLNFNWENPQYNIPFSLAIGKAFADNLTLNFGPDYGVSGPNKGDFTLGLNINTMFTPVN